jgi:filamentous hemagglutinin family protein
MGCFASSFAGALWAIAFIGNRALAQITPDATLGSERSVVTPNVDIGGFSTNRIDGGTMQGVNLFHSFLEFNVGSGQRVYFANPTGIENIFSRVTGSNPSNILGTLGVNGGASLFLLNPNGIIFGPNARLDITGSLTATTANTLVFGNGLKFSATNPEAPPLLTINLRPGLQYGPNHSRTLMNAGNLAVGQNLMLAAGNLDLQGQLHAGGDVRLFATDTIRIRDRATNPFIVSANGQLIVQGNQKVDIFALNHPNSGFYSLGDIVLRSANTVGGDAHYFTGGNFRIEQLDGNLGNLYSPYDPIIRSLGDVSFNSYLGTSLHILAGGQVNIGLIGITGPETGTAGIDFIAQNVTLTDGTVISIDGRARPTLDVRAGVDAAEVGRPLGLTSNNVFTDLFNFSPIGRPTITNTATSADIKIGGIAMLGRNAANGLVFLTNQYKPNPLLPGGRIEVGAIVTTDDTATALAQLPANLRNLLGSFGLLNGFKGNAGSVIVDSRSTIALTSSGFPEFGLTSSLINSSSASGNAGNVTLIARDAVSLANSFIFSDTFGAGRGGDIAIKARSVSLTNGTQVSASTSGTGQGGNLSVLAPDSVNVVGSNLFAATTGNGNAGNLTITTERLAVRDQAAVATLTFSEGNAGELRIATGQLIVRDGVIATSTLGGSDFGLEPAKGRGGDLIVNASDSVQLTSTSVNGKLSLDIPLPGFEEPIQTPIGLFSLSQSLGDAGNLTITTGRLVVQGGAEVAASTSSQGKGGNLTVNASERVELIGTSRDEIAPSGLFSETRESGNGGEIRVTTPKLIVRDGAIVSAGAGNTSTGKAGNLTVSAKLVELSGTSANLQTRSSLLTATAGSGDAGNLRIDTERLMIRDGALILAATLREGNGGNLIVNATDSVEVVGIAPDNLPSGLSTGTAGTGRGGDLTLSTNTLTVRDGGLVSAATYAQGAGGKLTVNASERVELSGKAADDRPSSLSAGSGIEGFSLIPLLQTFGVNPSKATGRGGDMQLTTGHLSVRDGAQITVSSQGTADAGNLDVGVRSIRLDNNGKLIAETGSGQGGNIRLQVQDLLLMRRNSLISTTAGNAQAGGNGGDITINAPFIVAIPNENSDIRANAYIGKGGNVRITAQGIFGTQFRPQDTPESDITASSTFGVSGTVQINTPDIDPSRGLTNLPTEVVDSSSQIAQNCPTGKGKVAQNEFTITGRGGLPESPGQMLSSDAVWTDLRRPSVESASRSKEETALTDVISQLVTPNPQLPIVEATGWVINDKGEVVLTASTLTVTPHNLGLMPAACPRS